MGYTAFFLVGVIAAVLALVVQVAISLLVPGFFSGDVTSPPHSLWLFWIVLAAAVEECIRVGLLFLFVLRRGFPQHIILSGLLAGIGFAAVEIILRASWVATFSEIIGLFGILSIHIILSILGLYLMRTLRFTSFIYTIAVLTFVHTLYNFFVLFSSSF